MSAGPDAGTLLAQLEHRGLTLAIAESLTGGLLIAEFVAVAGASAVIRGGVVAYATDVKHTVLGVDDTLLAEVGPVHPEVARQMASAVRSVFALDGYPADVGIATTGVAGPGPQGTHPVGEAFIGIADASGATAVRLELGGSREGIRRGVVSESLRALSDWIEML